MEWAWVIPVLGFAAFGLIALGGEALPDRGRFVSILAIVAGFVVFWPVLADFIGEGVGFYHFQVDWFSIGDLTVAWGILVDPLTVVMLGLVTFVAAAIQIYSLGYMAGDRRLPWYFAVQSLFAAAMLTLVLADNLLLLYFAWELVGLCSYLLIGFWYERRSAAEAAKKAFVTTRIGDVGLLIGIILLFVHTGTFDITEVLRQVTDPAPGEELSNALITGSALLVFLGAAGKSAQFPLHVWLPDAMEGPTPVSALIHAATMVTAGVFLVARMLPLFEASGAAMEVVAAVGLVTALAGGAMALVSTDIKRILAFSTMSHLGFMMLALGAGGFTAAIFHLLTHGIAKAMLFLAAGSVMHALREETDIRKMGGLRRRMPITAAAFGIGALALAGIPPLSAFWSKDEMLLAVHQGLHPAYLVAFLAAIALSALYMARVVRVAFFGALPNEHRRAHESPRVMTLPLVALGVLTLLAGFIAIPLGGGYGGIGTFLYEAVHGPHDFKLNVVLTTASIVLAVGGFAVGWWLYDRRADVVEAVRERLSPLHRMLERRLYLDDVYQWGIDRVVLRVGQATALFDRRVVNDRGVDGPAVATAKAGRGLRRHVTGLFADYGAAMVVGVLAIGIFLWIRVT